MMLSKRKLRWVQSWPAQTALVLVVMAALFVVFGEKAYGQNPTQENFASTKASQQESGRMGATSTRDLTSLTGTGSDPTAFGRELKQAYRRYVNNQYGKTFVDDVTAVTTDKGIHIPSPKDFLDAFRQQVECGSYMKQFDGWMDVGCKGQKAFNSVARDTADMTIHCALITSGSTLFVKGVTGQLNVKKVIYDTTGRHTVLVKNGATFLAGMAFCAMTHWWNDIPG